MKRLFLLLVFSLLLAACGSGKVRRYGVEVVRTYPHDTGAYTQGLFFHHGVLYESTGEYGASSFREVELASGKPLRRFNFDAQYFVEGSDMLDGKLYILTWTNKKAFVYDADSLRYLRTVRYPREGWGLTTDGRSLIASDGSSRLYFMDGDFKVRKTLRVTLDGKPLRLLNELEWIDGRIWANLYTSDVIAIIHPGSGRVEGLVDCSGLLDPSLRTPDTDVLNGIALSPDGKIYLTGKNWPLLFEVRLKRRSSERPAETGTERAARCR